MISYSITPPFNFFYHAPRYGICYIVVANYYFRIHEVLKFINNCENKVSNGTRFFYSEVLVNVDIFITVMCIDLVEQEKPGI